MDIGVILFFPDSHACPTYIMRYQAARDMAYCVIVFQNNIQHFLGIVTCNSPRCSPPTSTTTISIRHPLSVIPLVERKSVYLVPIML